jgi:glycosyltransferase involved in cell wall biosynthesis
MVTDIFFPDVMGGSGRVVNEIGKRLVRRGHNVHILTRRVNRNLPQEANIEGVRVRRYSVNPQNAVAFVASSLINSFQTFRQMLKETSFDLINFHQPLSAFGVSLSSEVKKIPKIYTFHSSWSQEYKIKAGKGGVSLLIRRWLEGKMLESCKKIIVLSEYSKRQVLDIYKLLSWKIEVISGGVDTVRFQPPREKEALKAELGIASDKLFLFTLRNLVPRMGLENLIEAMGIVVKEKPDVVLIIGGKGFLEERLKRQVKNSGLEGYIKFAGLIEEDKLPLYYQAADLFILPSRCLEGFGLVTLEALSCGTPVLGTPVGGTKEILGRLDKELLFKDIEAKSMAEKILLYSSSKDLLMLSKKCRDFVVSNYSWDRVIPQYERVYSEVIN